MATKSKPPEFGPTQRLQKAYEAGIRAITKRVLMPKRPEQTFEGWLADLARRSREWDVHEASEKLASQMVKWVNIKNAKTWRTAAARSMQSQRLYRLLQAEMEGATGARVSQLVRENAAYIRSIPLETALVLTDEVRKAQQSGARATTVAKMMHQRFPKLAQSRIHLIARTETAKASTALTHARCDTLNIEWFEWLTSEDKRVRPSHRNMDKVLVSWRDLPNPDALIGVKSTLGKGAAGDFPNCRCTLSPLLNVSDVSWPRRVYRQGAVKRMTLPEFRKIAGQGT